MPKCEGEARERRKEEDYLHTDRSACKPSSRATDSASKALRQMRMWVPLVPTRTGPSVDISTRELAAAPRSAAKPPSQQRMNLLALPEQAPPTGRHVHDARVSKTWLATWSATLLYFLGLHRTSGTCPRIGSQPSSLKATRLLIIRTNIGRKASSSKAALPLTRSATVLLSTRTCSRRPPGSHAWSSGCKFKRGTLSMACSRRSPGTGPAGHQGPT